jgi:multidrug efflux pump
MSKFFINRPNFAWVVALFICWPGCWPSRAAGGPVPQRGAAADHHHRLSGRLGQGAGGVGDQRHRRVAQRRQNLLYFESTSNSNGVAEVTVTFAGTDPDLAQVDVQNRLKRPRRACPGGADPRAGRAGQRRFPADLRAHLQGRDGRTTALGDYAARNINNELRRVPGVGKLQFFASEAAMRVWVDPQKLVGYGLSIDDVNNAIRGQNVQVPAGSFGSAPGASEQELTATLAVRAPGHPRSSARSCCANPDGWCAWPTSRAWKSAGSYNLFRA